MKKVIYFSFGIGSFFFFIKSAFLSLLYLNKTGGFFLCLLGFGLLAESLEIFRRELRDLGSVLPLILAFGRNAYDLITENLVSAEYGKLIRITHYSHQISNEKYRVTVFKEDQ